MQNGQLWIKVNSNNKHIKISYPYNANDLIYRRKHGNKYSWKKKLTLSSSNNPNFHIAGKASSANDRTGILIFKPKYLWHRKGKLQKNGDTTGWAIFSQLRSRNYLLGENIIRLPMRKTLMDENVNKLGGDTFTPLFL